MVDDRTVRIGKLLFGSNNYLKFTKKNLLMAVSSGNFKIMDSSNFGFKFIKIRENHVFCNRYCYKTCMFAESIFTAEEFWLEVRDRRNQLAIHEVRSYGV